ncbi:sterol desaturase family protein [bacterium]|nr:sterol desaturase family protein [bacterium]
MKILYVVDMDQLFTAFKLYWDRLLVPIDDPGSRLFYLNLLMTLVFVFVYALVYLKSKEPIVLLKKWIFRKKYWWNHSTKIDYQVYFLNGLFKVLIFIPWLDFSYFFSKKTVQALQWMSRDMGALDSNYFNLFSFTVFAFIIDDFLRFFHHFCMHKIPWLWRFHKTHHSAKVLTPITLYRAHPVEVLISTIRNSLSAGLAVGFFVYFFEAQVSYFQIFSVNLFGFAFNFLGSNLRHSHIPISFGLLENIFISPKQHQIHHSQNVNHYDKNFGVSLAIWDRLAGSLVFSKQVQGKIHFGVRGFSRQNLKKILF